MREDTQAGQAVSFHSAARAAQVGGQTGILSACLCLSAGGFALAADAEGQNNRRAEKGAETTPDRFGGIAFVKNESIRARSGWKPLGSEDKHAKHVFFLG